MYFRIKKTKTTPVLQLVHAFRDSQGNPRQKILLSLGNIEIPQNLWKPIIDEVEDMLHATPSLFQAPKEIREWAEKIVAGLQENGTYSIVSRIAEIPKEITADPAKIDVENVRELGPELVCKKAYEELGFDDILAELGFSPIQKRNAALTLINRVCEPLSEHALPAWLKTTALEDLYKTQLRKIGDDRFHRIADKLLHNKEEIEEKLAEKEKSLFNPDRSIYLYDLTNTYFEGTQEKNDMSMRGHSKEKRSDAPLISCGMVLDTEGFIIQHKVYPGNIGEPKTLQKVLEELQQKNEQKPIIIMDSGIASKANLLLLKEKGFDYITVAKRPSRLAYSEIFQDLTTFREISGKKSKQSVLIKTIGTTDEKLIACISNSRGEKEKAILSNSEKKYLSDLEKLKKSISTGHIKEKKKIQNKIGRLAERHHRVSRYYIVIHDEEKNILTWSRKDEEYNNALTMSGGYILKTSKVNLDDEKIWHLYIMLTKIESAFKALKSNLGLRPIYHQTARRCKAHILLTILAYHLLHWIETTLKHNGKLMSITSVKRVLQTHCYTTVVIPDKNNRIIRIRKPSIPDAEQIDVYKCLGIDYKSLPVTSLIAKN